MSTDIAVPPRIDVGAVAGSLYCEATARIAKTVSLAIEWFDEHGCPLTMSQKTALMRAALISAEGLEARFAEDLETILEANGMQTRAHDA